MKALLSILKMFYKIRDAIHLQNIYQEIQSVDIDIKLQKEREIRRKTGASYSPSLSSGGTFTCRLPPIIGNLVFC